MRRKECEAENNVRETREREREREWSDREMRTLRVEERLLDELSGGGDDVPQEEHVAEPRAHAPHAPERHVERPRRHSAARHHLLHAL